MAGIKFMRGTGVTASNPAVVDGQLIFATDTGIIYLDKGSDRVELYKHALNNVEFKDGKLKFYHDADKGDATPLEIDLPAEQFLDTAKTQFVENFTFSTATYPGATDPNLNGKPVLVLVLKDTKNTPDDATDDTYSYSFLNMEKLVDSDKADKIAITAADAAAAAAQEDEIVTMRVEGDGSTANPYKGNIKQSGKKIGTAIRAEGTADDKTVPTEKAVRTELEKKANIVDGGTKDNLVSLDANGDIQDSGFSGGTDTLTALATASDKVLATEKAVATELDKKVNAPSGTVTDKTLAIFDGTDGKSIKSSGASIVTAIDVDAAGGADDDSIPTELAVRTELDKKIDRVAEDNSKEDEILLANNKGYAKASGKKITTSVRPATLTPEEIADGKTVDNDTAHDDVIPTEKAVRAAIGEAVTGGLAWVDFPVSNI